MIDYKTDTRQAHAEGNDAASNAVNADELLKERRAYYYNLVSQVFGDEPKGREKSRKELEGLSVYDLLAMYATMRTSREIDTCRGCCREQVTCGSLSRVRVKR